MIYLWINYTTESGKATEEKLIILQQINLIKISSILQHKKTARMREAVSWQLKLN